MNHQTRKPAQKREVPYGSHWRTARGSEKQPPIIMGPVNKDVKSSSQQLCETHGTLCEILTLLPKLTETDQSQVLGFMKHCIHSRSSSRPVVAGPGPGPANRIHDDKPVCSTLDSQMRVVEHQHPALVREVEEILRNGLHLGETIDEVNELTTPELMTRRFKYCNDEGGYFMGRALYEVFSTKCRNCYLSGCGFDDTPAHCVADCKRMGAKCFIECKICGDGSKHWVNECPQRVPHMKGLVPRHTMAGCKRQALYGENQRLPISLSYGE